jgi:acetyl esterase
MPLDRQVQTLIEKVAVAPAPDFSALSITEYRQAGERFSSLAGTGLTVKLVEDQVLETAVGRIPVRLYHPQPEIKLPVMVFTHGGGYIRGSLTSHDALCSTLAASSECAVVSVDYRLAPEHPFPAAVNDAFAATLWVSENAARLNVDEEKLAVGGDSAGGCLAIATTLLARQRGTPKIAYQMLFYPATDAAMSSASWSEFGTGYLLTAEAARYGYDFYLPPGVDRRQELVSPLFAEDLSGLPPAFVITAEYDPLRDEGEEFVKRLREAGVAVEHRRAAGMIHNFMIFAGAIDAGQTAAIEAGKKLRQALG